MLARDVMEKSIEIQASPEQIWELLAWDRVHEWDEGYRKNLKSVEYTSEVSSLKDKYRVGATAHLTLKQYESDMEITESLPHEKLTFQSKGKRMNAIMTYLLEPVEGGTKFTYRVDYEIPMGLLGRALSRMFRGAGERDFETSLTNLKTILEQ
jgi:uncharacterized membrane protein